MNFEIDNNHLYNVYLRTGLVRMTGWEAEREFGRDVWERYTEVIDHSEWCECRKVGPLSDPFLDGEPPF